MDMESFMVWMQDWIGTLTIISVVLAVMFVIGAVAVFLRKVEEDDQPGLKHEAEPERERDREPAGKR